MYNKTGSRLGSGEGWLRQGAIFWILFNPNNEKLFSDFHFSKKTPPNKIFEKNSF